MRYEKEGIKRVVPVLGDEIPGLKEVVVEVEDGGVKDHLERGSWDAHPAHRLEV
jgi:hypothetical protein